VNNFSGCIKNVINNPHVIEFINIQSYKLGGKCEGQGSKA
jgi:hypothetical protein